LRISVSLSISTANGVLMVRACRLDELLWQQHLHYQAVTEKWMIPMLCTV